MKNDLNVALVQTHLLWENPVANRKQLETKIKAIDADTDVIVLPEMFTTGFTMQPQIISEQETEKAVAWMQTLAKEKDAAIVGSLAFKEKEDYYNRLLFVAPSGDLHAYDKKHTFTLAGENKVYKSGIKKITIPFRGFSICPLICYDLRFPVWARNTTDYDVLLYVANWPKPRITAWDTLLKARAIENMAYCIGVNRIGIDGYGYEYPGHSAVYDVLGNPLAFSEKDEVLHVQLSKNHITQNREKLRFLDDKDAFTLLS
ncbi:MULTISPECIES: amidohydrolase [Flavobacteriaceae]|uniref:amidohydrolase n=1 Tax=Flavobacteriaceae TaxID=49546 RepID=UPI0010AEAA11|nr:MULTISPECIES: amidohydrolase [Flavobacteriaceae]NJB36877.1 amidohydrolase [Croceivirga sp. JEA036]TKD65309.1 amidohydrolase [Flavobacterium sp. ASW18X]